MSDSGYRLLGFVVWRAAKWYARRRVPAASLPAAGALAGLAALALLALLARRSSS